MNTTQMRLSLHYSCYLRLWIFLACLAAGAYFTSQTANAQGCSQPINAFFSPDTLARGDQIDLAANNVLPSTHVIFSLKKLCGDSRTTDGQTYNRTIGPAASNSVPPDQEFSTANIAEGTYQVFATLTDTNGCYHFEEYVGNIVITPSSITSAPAPEAPLETMGGNMCNQPAHVFFQPNSVNQGDSFLVGGVVNPSDALTAWHFVRRCSGEIQVVYQNPQSNCVVNQLSVSTSAWRAGTYDVFASYGEWVNTTDPNLNPVFHNLLNVGTLDVVKPPKPPANLTATASAGAVSLAWTLLNNTNATSIKVLRSSTGPNGSYSKIAVLDRMATSFVDSTVIAGTNYCYVVRTINSAGSADSTVACVTP